MDWNRGDYVVSDEPRRLDRARIWRFLSQESYWAGGIPETTVEKALEHSLCFGLYRRGASSSVPSSARRSFRSWHRSSWDSITLQGRASRRCARARAVQRAAPASP